MNNGIVCFANNNGQVDYIKQAVFLAKRAKKYLDLPVSVVTDTPDRVPQGVFDKILSTPVKNTTYKNYYDGTLTKRELEFKNTNRSSVYDITPYTDTLVLDTDYIICSDNLKRCFSQNQDFLIYDKSCDLAQWRETNEFNYINSTGIKFYWATCMFIRKSEKNKILFDLVEHIKENWSHYHLIYKLGPKTFRNDFAFSIAIHLLKINTSTLPGKMYYTLDRDLILDIKDDKLTMLLEKQGRPGEYTAMKTQGLDIHVMNKFSLGRLL